MTPSEATSTLSKYLGKTLRVHTTDNRAFVGQMKCTDNECNVILALTQEYRKPAPATVIQEGQTSASVKLHSRYVGLVIVPGKHITKIEHEEFLPSA